MLAILILGAAPLLLVAARFTALGEFALLTDVRPGQGQLYGPLDLAELSYKVRMAKAIRPRVLLLGSSQVLEFRSTDLSRCSSPGCFYNAGAVMPTIRAGADMYADLVATGRAPEVVLLALDLWHFNPRYEENVHEPTELTRTPLEDVRLALGVTRKYAPQVVTDPGLRDLVLGRLSVPDGLRGARAVLRSEGFRADGSYSYGTVNVAATVARTPAERSADAVGRIARDCCRFQRFAAADQRSLDELERLLAVAASAGTKVVAFSVPLSDDVMDAIDRDPAEAASFRAFEDAVHAVLARHDLAFITFPRASAAGCGPLEMIDGFHPGEVCAARVLMRVASVPTYERTLASYVDPADLARRIDRRSSDLLLEAQ